MKKKKLIILSNDLNTSIKYSVLTESIDELVKSNTSLADKKTFFGSNDKRIEQNNITIENINNELINIKNTNKESSYLILEKDNLENHLSKIKNITNYKLVKYEAIIRYFLEGNNFEYVTNKYIEDLSTLLFDDKREITNIQNNLKKITDDIYGNQMKNIFDSGFKLLQKIPLNRVTKLAAFTPPGAMLLIGGALGTGILSTSYFTLKKKARKMSILSPGDLANDLILSAIKLYYMKEVIDDDYEYIKFARRKLKEINAKRNHIYKEAFELFKEYDNNVLKIEMLHNFDNYITNVIKLKEIGK